MIPSTEFRVRKIDQSNEPANFEPTLVREDLRWLGNAASLCPNLKWNHRRESRMKIEKVWGGRQQQYVTLVPTFQLFWNKGYEAWTTTVQVE